MSFEEQLRQALDPLADSVRDEIRRQIDAAMTRIVELGRDARQAGVDEGRTLGWEDGRGAGRAEALADAEQRTRDAVDTEVAAARADVERTVGERIALAVAAARAEAERDVASRLAAMEAERRTAPTQGQAALDRLADAIRSLDRARSLSEILDTVTACAGRDAERAAMLVVRGDRLRGWRFIGFDRSFDEASSIEIGIDEAGIVADAVRTRAAASGAPPTFAQPATNDGTAVPLTVADEVVAVLYADQGAIPTGIDVLARHAARCLEAVVALKAARSLTDPSWLPVT